MRGQRPSWATIYRHFGSWPKAIEAARAAIEGDRPAVGLGLHVGR
ncbi:MAG: homing endonuclease associated repeat-containing protein [Candidatus Dormibacteraceae bacterium]